MVVRGFLADCLPGAALTLTVWTGASAVLAGLTLLWSGPVIPKPALWLALVAWSVPASLTPAIVIGATLGVLGATARWHREGALTGLAASGASGRVLLLPALLLSLAAAGTTALWTHAVAPWAHDHYQRGLADAASQVSFVPGQAVELAGWTLLPEQVVAEEAADVLLVGPELAGSAARARVVRAADGIALELTDGVLLGQDPPTRLQFARYVHPLPLERSRRIQLDERTSAELAEVVDRTEAAGGNAAYEHAVLIKRSLHPLVALLLPLALLPAGAGQRPGWAGAGAVVGWLVVVRLGDQLAVPLGALPSASAGTLFALVWGAVAWARWRDA